MGGMIYWKQIKESKYVQRIGREPRLAHIEMRYCRDEGCEKIGT